MIVQCGKSKTERRHFIVLTTCCKNLQLEASDRLNDLNSTFFGFVRFMNTTIYVITYTKAGQLVDGVV